jgi:hypothetical protein
MTNEEYSISETEKWRKKYQRQKIVLSICAVLLCAAIIFGICASGVITDMPALDIGIYGTGHSVHRIAEETQALSEVLQSRGGYCFGTNKHLRGNVIVHLFFVNDGESQWNSADISEITGKQVLPGLAFLEKQAESYGIPLEFTVQTYTRGTVTGKPIEYHGRIDREPGDSDRIPNQIANQFGHNSGLDMYRGLYNKYNSMESIFLYVVNKSGTSRALMQVAGDRRDSLLEYGVIFNDPYYADSETEEITYTAATVAHEILHLYGAVDMYESVYRRLLGRLYPRDIMVCDYLYVEDMLVGEYTAYAVGWIHSAPDLHP